MRIIVSYKRVKRLSMRVTQQGEVHVSAPAGILKSEVERFVRDNEQWIRKAVARVEQSRESRQHFYDQLPYRTRAERADVQQRIQAKVEPFVEHYQRLMGVQCSGITYKAVKSRWGSCETRSRHLTFSIYLLLLPDWCIEHVVVHELAHLLVPNHSPAFYAVMDRYFPRWKEARLATRQLAHNATDAES